MFVKLLIFSEQTCKLMVYLINFFMQLLIFMFIIIELIDQINLTEIVIIFVNQIDIPLRTVLVCIVQIRQRWGIILVFVGTINIVGQKW